MAEWIDPTLYPDAPVPETLESEAEKVDFLVRLCGAWDFGVLPDMATIREIRKECWREAVDGCRLLTSIAYHVIRDWHKLPEQQFLGQRNPEIADDPCLQMT